METALYTNEQLHPVEPAKVYRRIVYRFLFTY